MNFIWYIVPLAYFFSQNNYYGWNHIPQSDSELIADGITLILIVLVHIGTIINGMKGGTT